MTNTESNPMPWQTKLGVAVALAILAGVAALNASGWLYAWGPIVGGVAAFFAVTFEVLGFVLWEHIRAALRDGAKGAATGGVVFLAAVVATNVYGGHHGLEFMAHAGGMYEQAEHNRERAQSILDQTRRDFQTNEIAPVQTRIDAVTKPDLSGGPQNDAREIQAWEALTAADRAELERLQRRLDTMATVAPAIDPFPAELRVAISALFAALSVFLLSVLRVSIPGMERRGPAKRARPKPRTPSHQGENVIDLGTARDNDKRDAETVRRLKSQNYSLRQIEAETGISKSRAQRLLAAQ